MATSTPSPMTWQVIPETPTRNVIPRASTPVSIAQARLPWARTDERHIDANGQEDYSKQKFTLFMKGMEGGIEASYAQSYRVDQHQFDKENDIHLSFTPDQMTQLSQCARDYVAKMDKITPNGFQVRNRGDAFIDTLAKAQNPGDVANALTQYSSDPHWMGDAMLQLSLVVTRDTPLPGNITARNRNA
ncbi:hypothetical protein [Cystobacter fuscus]|uniref:hypothetical protein n=1 Tax=Cystobacter fuscus TaxID=43 RepID=UPI002B2B93FA|nr:hypothetical protein F0U63_21115 [Cystobacter fuscus]